jgi:hypothetical protein
MAALPLNPQKNPAFSRLTWKSGFDILPPA